MTTGWHASPVPVSTVTHSGGTTHCQRTRKRAGSCLGRHCWDTTYLRGEENPVDGIIVLLRCPIASPLIPVPPAAPLPAQLALRTSTSSMTYPISGQLHISSSPSLQSIQSFASRRAFHNSKPVISADHWKDQGWAHGASPYTPTCLPDALGVQLLTPGAHSLHMIRLLVSVFKHPAHQLLSIWRPQELLALSRYSFASLPVRSSLA